jgi:hypothetical protein
MSSGHVVTEYEFDTSGLQPMLHHKNRGKTDGKSMTNHVFCEKNKEIKLNNPLCVV